MVFLPVVERELRVAARGRTTYRVRFWAVLVMLGVFVWFLNFSGMDPDDSWFGEEVMRDLLIPAFVLSLFIGVIATADCVSSEKREGTLGLLFLTDLKGYDVICGKLAANSVNAIYGLVAILPVLGLPVMLGGVTFAQFVKLAVALFTTMIFSLSVGIFVSTYSRNDRKAMFFTVLILLAITVLPILLTDIYGEAISISGDDLWRTYMFSPGYGLIQTMDTVPFWTFPEFSYWLSMLWQWLLAAALIARSCDHIPHSWEESAAKKKPRLARLKLAARAKARSAKGRAWLERNPFLWLAMQDEEASPRHVWLFVLAIWAIWVIAVLNFGMINMGDARMVTVTILTLHTPLLIWIAAQASRRFSEDRSNNTFETLLSTPLSARQIIRGQWLALLRQFAAPIAVVLVWELLMEINGDAWQRDQLRSCWPRTLLLAPDAAALAWAGMWLGLKCKSRIRAILGSLILVLFVPWLVRTVITGVMGRLSDMSFSMGPGYPQHEIDFQKWLMTVSLAIQLLMDFLILIFAKSRLSRTFRQLAVRR
jgi:ABC-type transport system involved in multi-copper enzyme maturation permease subunit